MHVGFTGTQEGMTPLQLTRLSNFLDQLKIEGYTHFHHGDCKGADAEAHILALSKGFKIILHPPISPIKRAYCKFASEVREKKEYLTRNQEIVEETEILLATPKEMKEELRSGTWATVRKGWKKNPAQVRILYPRNLTFEEAKVS